MAKASPRECATSLVTSPSARTAEGPTFNRLRHTPGEDECAICETLADGGFLD